MSMRYHRVSQHENSEDEITLYELGSDRSFGTGIYDMSHDLELPPITKGSPSRTKFRLKRRSRLRSVMAVCLFVVLLCAVLAVVVGVVAYSSYLQRGTPADEQTTETTPPNAEATIETGGTKAETPPPETPPPDTPPATEATETTPPETPPPDTPPATEAIETTPPETPPPDTPPATSTTPPAVETTPFESTSPKTVTPPESEATATTPPEPETTPPDMPPESETTPTNVTTQSPPSSNDTITPTTEEHPSPDTTTAGDKATSDVGTPPSPEGITPSVSLHHVTSSLAGRVTTTPTPQPQAGGATETNTTAVGGSTAEPGAKRSISWQREFYPALTECTLQLYDMNRDGTLDTLAVDDYSQCSGRIVFMDGKTGDTIWKTDVPFLAFAVRCELDVNSDGMVDCLACGRTGGFVALNGIDGSVLWHRDPDIAYHRYNFYFPLIVPDLDGDGTSDLINVHGGDATYGSGDIERSPAKLVVVSGRTGRRLLQETVLVPDGHESYMSPELYSFADGTEVVLFGSGGETLPGSLWAVTLSSIQDKVLEYTNTSTDYANDTVFVDYINHPCTGDLTYDELEALRPVFDESAYNFSERASGCPQWGEPHPIWNKYGLCVYEVVRTESTGVILPPVIVDMTGDGHEDLVISLFEGHTLLLDGRGGKVVWDTFIPRGESYSIPTPLFYTEDDTPDLLVRVNVGKWGAYDYSYVAILNGSDGQSLWTLSSTLTGMMSGVSLVSDQHGYDAALFVSVGTAPTRLSESQVTGLESVLKEGLQEEDSNAAKSDSGTKLPENGGTETSELGIGSQATEEQNRDRPASINSRSLPYQSSRDPSTPSDSAESSEHSHCTHRYFEGPESPECRWYEWLSVGGEAFVREKRHSTGEEEERGSGAAVEDDHEGLDYEQDFIVSAVEARDPPGLWEQRVGEMFPDPHTHLEEFMVYCGHSMEQMTAYLYLVTRRLAEGGDVRPLAQHKPYVYIPPSSMKRHGQGSALPHKQADTPEARKKLRCAHIAAPVMSPVTPAIADLDGDGRLEVAYALVWGNIDRNAALITPPKLLVEVLTLEDRFTEVYGEERVDFSRFLPSAQQPWSRYMGATGDGVFRLQH